jgi:hypothetical protein
MRRWSSYPMYREERCEYGSDFSQDARMSGWTTIPSLQEARSYLRLVGWCFWDSDTLLNWGIIGDHERIDFGSSEF